MDLDEKLSDDDLVMIVLSGAIGGDEMIRFRKLRDRVTTVLHNEEYPAPKTVDGKKVKVKPHKWIEGRRLTDGERANKNLDNAFLNAVLSGSIERLGYGGDYLVYSSIHEWAEKAKKDSGISDKDYNYLKNLGKKARGLF